VAVREHGAVHVCSPLSLSSGHDRPRCASRFPSSTVGLRPATIPPREATRRDEMPDVLYVGLQEDDKIVSFGIDAGSGKLVPSGETPAAGAPAGFAVSPDRGGL